MNYIAALDYQHLDNSLFLKAFADSLSRQEPGSGLIIHGQSAHTERLIQTGMMRSDAARRAVKELNHRLIALLADHGVAAIGLHGFQKSLVRQTGDGYQVDRDQFNKFPSGTFPVLSNLVETGTPNETGLLGLDNYASLLKTSLGIDEIMVFSLDDSEEFIQKNKPAEIEKKDIGHDFAEQYIPGEFHNTSLRFRLTTARIFGNYPDNKGSTFFR